MIKSMTCALIPSALAVAATALLACCASPALGLLPGGVDTDFRSLLVVLLLLAPSVLTLVAVEYWMWRRSAALRRI